MYVNPIFIDFAVSSCQKLYMQYISFFRIGSMSLMNTGLGEKKQ